MPAKRKLHHHVFRLGWGFFAFGVIAVAVVVSVVRMLLPLLQEYRVDIEQLASQQLGRPVHIAEVRGGWYGLHPQLRFVNVSIDQPGGKRVWLHLKQLQASVNVIKSLWNWRIETSRINFIGLKLEIDRHRDGAYSVSGVQTGRGGVAGHGGKRLLAWLVAHQRVSVLDSDISWKDPRLSSKPLHFSRVDLRMDKLGDLYRFDGAARLAGQGGRQLSFVLNVASDPNRPDAPRSRIYLDGSLQMGPWLNGDILSHTTVENGVLDFKLWGEGANRMDRLVGDISVHDLRWRHRNSAAGASEVQRFSLRSLSTVLFWRRVGRGWTLDMRHLRIVRAGGRWPESKAHVVYERSDDGTRRTLEGHFGFVRLQDLRALLLGLSGLDRESRGILSALAPRGDLTDFGFAIHEHRHQGNRYFVAARFHDLGFHQWGHLPGVSGLDGHLVFDQDHGYLALASRDAKLNYPRLFGAPLAAQRLAGQLYWRRDADHWHLVARHVQADNADIRGRGRFRMDVPLNGSAPFIDMQLAYSDGDVAQAYKYLPRRIMPPKTVAWLDRALAGGRLTSGRMLYYGRASDFPFAHGQGVFEAEFGVEDGILDYAPGWPRVDAATIEVEFHNRSMGARVADGKVFNLNVEPSTVEIDDLSKQGTVTVDARLRGPVHDMLRYVSANPLVRKHRDAIVAVGARGNGDVSAHVELPLDRISDGTARGYVDLAGDHLALNDTWQMALSQIDGRLNFAVDGTGVALQAKGVAARFRGQPAQLDVKTSGRSGARTTRVDLRSRLNAAALGATKTAFLKHYLLGRSDWRISALVSTPAKPGDYRVGLVLSSNLRGTEVKLPEELYKPKDTARPFELHTELTSGGMGPVRIAYGTKLSAVLALKNGTLAQGEIRMGGGAARLPVRPGLAIAGSVPEISLSRWRNWSAKLGSDTSLPNMLSLISSVNLNVGTLELFDYRIRDLALHANKAVTHWSATVRSREIAGQLTVPLSLAGDVPVVLNLDHLHLVGPKDAGDQVSFDPRRLPALKVSSKLFSYNHMGFGRLELVARRVADGLAFDRLDLNSRYFSVKATGSWKDDVHGQATRFYIKAQTDNLGEALKHLGYAGSIEGGKGRAQVEADWKGSPSAFAFKKLHGSVHLTITDGQLLAVHPGGGRVFGLLSLQALPRRLSLDFSDIFGRGFGFDRIDGRFAISDGDAYTNDLYMSGPSARIDVSGRVGLATRDYDETAVVTPRVTSGLAVVGGLAGGPTVGLGLWLAERVFGKKIDAISRSYYTITGSWDHPKVERSGEAQPKPAPSSNATTSPWNVGQ